MLKVAFALEERKTTVNKRVAFNAGLDPVLVNIVALVLSLKKGGEKQSVS
ncbi:MAG: hypothetical protein Cons2KO_33260 [Congregibacter sp.]